MAKLLKLCDTLLGFIGLLLCVAVVVLAWWLASGAVRRVDVVATRLDERLASADLKLTRIEQRVSTASAELTDLRRDAEARLALNPEPARIKAEIEGLENRLVPILDRVRVTADSLATLAEILLAAADVVSELNPDGNAAAGLRNAAGSIDRAGAALSLSQEKIDAVATSGVIQASQKFLALAGKAIEGSDLLASGLATARREAADARAWTTEFRDLLVFRVYGGALVVTLLAIWSGMGQLCLIGHGRCCNSGRVVATR